VSVEDLAAAARKAIAVLSTATLAQAYALLEEAEALYVQCAEGTRAAELPDAVRAVQAARDAVATTHQTCGEVTQLLKNYLANLGAEGASSGGSATATPPPATTASTSAPTATPAAPAGRSWQTVAEQDGAAKSYPSYSAAKRELGSNPGQELNHIVEQCQAKPDRTGFDVERVNTTDNFVWLPVPVHRKITAFYARKPPGMDTTRRDTMNGMSWDEQYRRGQRVVTRALREDEQHE
jgi:hypothetical protein